MDSVQFTKLMRSQVELNVDSTVNTHSYLELKLTRYDHRAQIQCLAQNSVMERPLAKVLELRVQRKY